MPANAHVLLSDYILAGAVSIAVGVQTQRGRLTGEPPLKLDASAAQRRGARKGPQPRGRPFDHEPRRRVHRWPSTRGAAVLEYGVRSAIRPDEEFSRGRGKQRLCDVA